MRSETSVERLNDDEENVDVFCYLGNALNAGCGSKMTVVTRARIEWMRFQECKFLYGRQFFMKMKGKVYQICVRSALLYESKIWTWREREMEILKRTKRAMIRAK